MGASSSEKSSKTIGIATVGDLRDLDRLRYDSRLARDDDCRCPEADCSRTGEERDPLGGETKFGEVDCAREGLGATICNVCVPLW